MTIRPPRHPRWLNGLWAVWRGYFWIDCPRCGRPFGGHEDTGTAVPKPGQIGVASLACWRCVVSPAQQAQETFDAWGYSLVDMRP